MLAKLRERYASTKLSTRMSLIAELHNLRYKYGDMGGYLDIYAALPDRLKAMNAKIPTELAIIMFLHSMNGNFEATIAALKTMSDDSLTWNDVTASMIEESSSHSRTSSTTPQAALILGSTLPTSCSSCGKHGHESDTCWWNPNNPKNRFRNKAAENNTKHKAANASYSQGRSDKSRTSKNSRIEKSNKEKALMLNVVKMPHTSPYDFLLDSGASSHMSPNQDWFHILYQIPLRQIILGDSSKVTATAAGDIMLKLPYKNGAVLKLLITEVLYVPDLSLNLLSCFKLAERDVACIFDKTECMLIDKSDNDDILAKAYLKSNLYWLTSATPVFPPESSNSAISSNKIAISK
jgi:gag-polypeptide of LTR copia-type